MKAISFDVRQACFVALPLLSLALAVGCGGDNSAPESTGTGGSSTSTGTGGTTTGTGGTTTGTGGGGTTGSGGTTGGSGGTGGTSSSGVCSHTAIPGALGTITDFDPWASGMWGEDMGLTGGQLSYQATDQTALTATVTDGVMNITGSITLGYAGWGMWFGPCSDASMYTGISFSIGGTIGETGQALFQVQSSRNYPIDTANMKGECEGDWGSGCANNEVELTIPATPAVVQIPFADVIGGEPITPLDPTELLGIQFQFNCEAAATCDVDVTIDDVMFY